MPANAPRVPPRVPDDVRGLLTAFRNVVYSLGLACGGSEDCPKCGAAVENGYEPKDREELHREEAVAKSALLARLGRLCNALEFYAEADEDDGGKLARSALAAHARESVAARAAHPTEERPDVE